MDITLNELEQAINYWRGLRPSTGEERALSAEVNALAKQYALMIFNRLTALPISTLDPVCHALVLGWQSRSGTASQTSAP